MKPNTKPAPAPDRRPGIQEVKHQLRQQHPNKSDQELNVLAKMEWQKRQHLKR